MARKPESSAHSKYLIMYHLIFVAKYRKKIFSFHYFDDVLKQKFLDISSNYDFSIDTIDLDYSKPDRIHVLVRSIPTWSPDQIVRVLKQEANIWAWNNYGYWFKKKFYHRSHHLFTRGYYCGSVGNVSADTVAKYLEDQGRNEC